MFKLFVFLSLVMSQMAFAYEPTGQEECVRAANTLASDPGMYGNQPGPFWIDSDGKVVNPDKSRIVRQKTENGVDTYTYKTQQYKFVGSGKSPETEMIERNISIKRDSSGKLISMSKNFDIEPQLKMQEEWNKNGYQPTNSILKSSESTFDQSSKECRLDQTVSTELNRGKIEKNVTFDKKFCDKIAPMVKQMGSQNANQCAGLIQQANAAFETRNKELAKEEKALKTYNILGDDQTFNNRSFNLAMVIQSCAAADQQMWGYNGGMYGPMTYYNGIGMGGLYPQQTGTSKTDAKTTDSSQSNKGKE